MIEARYEGLAVNYCPYVFVDNDATPARGWTHGYSKKLGSVFQTRTFAAPSAAACPLPNPVARSCQLRTAERQC